MYFKINKYKDERNWRIPSNNLRSLAQDEDMPGFADEQKGKLEEAENYCMPIKNQPGSSSPD